MENCVKNGFLEPRTPTETKLALIWCRALELAQLSVQEDFFAAGGDSLAAAQVMAEIKKEFGQDLPVSALLRAPTVKALAAEISRRTDPSRHSPLVALQPHGPHPPFYCVHGAGGEVLTFAELARHFAPEQPFYGLRAVPCDQAEPPRQRIEDLAANYLKAIRALQPTGPYYLGGFSLGGSVALEMAQQLRAQKEEVGLLAILDHTPPPTRYRELAWTPGGLIDFCLNAVRWVIEDIWNAGPRNRLRALRQMVATAGGRLALALHRRGPASGQTDLQYIFAGRPLPDQFRQVMEAHYNALRAYKPKAYPEPVTLFRARTRPLFRLHERDLGWRKLARDLEVVAIPGNHLTILKEPHVSWLARALLVRLRRAQAIHSSQFSAVGAPWPATERMAWG